MNIENCIAEELAKARTELVTCAIVQIIGALIASVRMSIIHSFYVEPQSWWQQEDLARIAVFCWTLLDNKRTNYLLSLKRMAIYRTIAIVSSHCTFGRRAELWVLAGGRGYLPSHVSMSCSWQKEILDRSLQNKDCSHKKFYHGVWLGSFTEWLRVK